MRAPPLGRPVWAVVVAVSASACGDDVPDAVADAGTGADTGPAASTTTADASGSGSGSGSTAAGSESPESPDADTTAAGTTGAATETGAALDVQVDVVTYPAQPMVVDLVFSSPDLVATVEHARDPGVRAAVVASSEDTTRVRVRGLAPLTEHALSYTVHDDSGAQSSGDVVVTTEPALIGYVPSFVQTGEGPAPDGYVLFDMVSFGLQTPSSMFMVDASGTTRWHLGVLDAVQGIPIIHAAATLQPDGSVVALRGDALFAVDELGTRLWTVTAEEIGLPGLHHEALPLANGNYLTLSYVFAEVDYPDLGPTWVAADLVVEVSPQGDVLWEWNALDHLDPLRRRDGFETVIVDPATNTDAADWSHGNGLLYDEATDTVLLSLRHQDWLVAIDRATGDVVWRWGDEGDFTLSAGTWAYHQHSPQWQADGTLLMYDNGVGNPALDDALETSRAVRYSLDLVGMSTAMVWQDAAEDFVSAIAGDANRLPDGTILVTDSAIAGKDGVIAARIRKIDEASSAVPQWALQTGFGQLVYRAMAYDRLAGEVR